MGNGGPRILGSASIALPGRKLATSRTPRMLTPSEVDLLRQDLQAALKVLGQDELDDAHGLLRARGLAPTDFEVIQRAEPSPEGRHAAWAESGSALAADRVRRFK